MTSGVLVVDDNRAFADLARFLLERQGEHVVGVASTCAEAAQLVAELRPAIVLVDLTLGDECGLDLVRLLAQDSNDAPTVIVISARSQADVEDLVAASPAAGFLPKSDLSADAIRRIVVGGGISGGGPPGSLLRHGVPRESSAEALTDIFE